MARRQFKSVLNSFCPKRSTLAQASACAYQLTSVRWSQTDRFAKADVNRVLAAKRFRQKLLKTLLICSLLDLRLGVMSSFTSRWLATSGRWSVFRHKRTLAPEYCVLGKNCSKRL
jgi:hypothetical protein